VVSYSWSFGNGGTSTAISPTVTYTEQGTYTVRLTVTTASGCSETYSLPEAVSVGVKPVANFSATPREVCAYQGVTFTNLGSGANAWEWDFGDGTKSVVQNPVHLYSDTGTFTVKLIANNNGCVESMTIPRYITIKPPVARFDYQTTCSNKLFLAFKDMSLGATSWEWDFGDGSKSTDPSPSHTFPRFGTYPVKLTVRNDTCFHILTRLISISSGVPDFTVSPPSVCKGSSVEFKADTTNSANIVSYSWNFGNGSQPATGRIVSASYQTAGLFDVSLTITDHNGCVDSLVKKQAIRISGPTAGIKASNNNGCKGLRANFTDASKDDGRTRITTWRWNLGDGTVINQTTPAAIQHTYASSGSFDVSLKVTDAGGCSDSLLLPALVNTSFIQAGFTSADTISCPGAAINFTNTSAAMSDYTSTWTFGNGQQSQQLNPTTKYDREGRYTISLTIKDTGGCTDTYIRENYVSVNYPRASFTVNDSVSSCTPFQVNFTNTSSNYIDHVWTLNGGTSVLPNPTQFYNDPGVYETSLIVTSPGGCRDSAKKKITVFDMSAAKLDYLPLNGCKPLLVNVKAATPVKMNLIWDFGDGNIVNNNDLNRQHTYNFFGDFVPKVIMTDSSGCIITVTGLDTIRIQGATAKFGLDRRLLCDSGLVRFTDSTTTNNAIASYHWNFGNGETSSEPSPDYYFSRPGTYPVSLSVKTENQCVDTFKLQIPIRVVASPAIRIGGDTVICVGESLTHIGLFDRVDTLGVQWSWQFPNGRTGTGQMPFPQTYNVPGKMLVQTTAVNSSGCKDTAIQPIYVNPLPTVQLPATISTLVGTPVLLPAVYSGTMSSYLWSLPDNLSCTTCPQPIASPKMDTKYTVAFVDNNGCRNVGQVQVIVLCKNENVFIPNTFSPNGDGSNDIFYVRGRGLSRVKTMRIFNRWGQVVFERLNFNVNDASVGWDGTFKGAKAIPDVYVYQVEIFCDNNQVVKYDGNVALIQ
jgi:gliding motility-associated-like protein